MLSKISSKGGALWASDSVLSIAVPEFRETPTFRSVLQEIINNFSLGVGCPSKMIFGFGGFIRTSVVDFFYLLLYL